MKLGTRLDLDKERNELGVTTVLIPFSRPLSDSASTLDRLKMQKAAPRDFAATTHEALEIDIAACRVIIVGSQSFFNQLLAEFIHTKAGIDCLCVQNPEAEISRAPLAPQGSTLLMIDARAGSQEPQRSMPLECQTANRSPSIYHCLFNVGQSPDARVEREAIQSGIRGIFYQDDPPAIMLKGIKAVLSGELWYSREALARCLLESRSALPHTNAPGVALTQRERQILLMIASGLSNDEIAQNLNLSAHTIKTHAYNIYRKINVPNRIQASLWVAQYLQG